MRKIAVLFCLVLFCYLCACKKQQPNPPVTPTFNPTTYSLVLPGYLSSLPSRSDPPDNPLTIEGVALGRKLFYEKMLSNDASISCASCHKQENAFSDPRRFSIGTDGSMGNRNAMSIFNHTWSRSFFWDGRRHSLEGQAHDPVSNPIEMESTWPVVVQRLQQDPNYPDLFFAAFGTSTIDSDLVTRAIAQFERTIISFNSKYDKQAYQNQHVFTQQEMDGEVVYFEIAKCAHCHTGVLLEDTSFHNNGLDLIPTDSGLAKITRLSSDYGKFKTPSLRNIALTAPYMHDGRFSTLQEVVHFYSAQVSQGSPNLDSSLVRTQHGALLTQQQEDDLVAFLQTLTDSTLITNPDYKAP